MSCEYDFDIFTGRLKYQIESMFLNQLFLIVSRDKLTYNFEIR